MSTSDRTMRGLRIGHRSAVLVAHALVRAASPLLGTLGALNLGRTAIVADSARMKGLRPRTGPFVLASTGEQGIHRQESGVVHAAVTLPSGCRPRRTVPKRCPTRAQPP